MFSCCLAVGTCQKVLVTDSPFSCVENLHLHSAEGSGDRDFHIDCDIGKFFKYFDNLLNHPSQTRNSHLLTCSYSDPCSIEERYSYLLLLLSVLRLHSPSRRPNLVDLWHGGPI